MCGYGTGLEHYFNYFERDSHLNIEKRREKWRGENLPKCITGELKNLK